MIQYLKVVRCLVSDFLYWNITKILSAENTEVDRQSKYAFVAILSLDNVDEGVFVEYLPTKYIDVKVTEVIPVKAALVEDRPETSSLVSENWMTPYLDYLQDGILLADKKEAKSLMF